MDQPWGANFHQIEEAAYIASICRDATIVLAQLPVFKGSHLLYVYQLAVNARTACVSRVV